MTQLSNHQRNMTRLAYEAGFREACYRFLGIDKLSKALAESQSATERYMTLVEASWNRLHGIPNPAAVDVPTAPLEGEWHL